MKTVGIICEYNPFHNGHMHHLQKAREIADGGIVIAILTGYFSMRGDISVINKYDKVKTAIDKRFNIALLEINISELNNSPKLTQKIKKGCFL